MPIFKQTGKIIVNRLSFDTTTINSLKKSYFAFDTETTGLSAKTDRIVELGAVLFENGKPVQEYSSLVNPHVQITSEVTKINHITNEMIYNARDERVVYKEFVQFFNRALNGKVIVVAHNAKFDMDFLKNTLERLGYSGMIYYADTMAIAKTKLSLSNYKQETILKYLHIENPAAHRASSDALCCGMMLYKMLTMSNPKKIDPLAPLCPKCHQPMVLRSSKTGNKFYGCSTYPNCNGTRVYEEETMPICPMCGGRMRKLKSRFGNEFYGCSNYPACKYTKNIE